MEMNQGSKTQSVVNAMIKLGGEDVLLSQLHALTGLEYHILGGILASLEKQERVLKYNVKGHTRKHWKLLLVEKPSRADSSAAERRRRRQSEKEEINQLAALHLHAAFANMVRTSQAHHSYT
jgi:hypothetical protein